MISADTEPNFTGRSVMRCAAFHIAVYCRLAAPTGLRAAA